MRETYPMRSSLALPCVVAALVLASSCGRGAAPPSAVPEEPAGFVLQWRMTPEEALVYVQTIESAVDLPQAMGTMITTIESTQRWSVLQVADIGDMTLRIQTDRVRMNLDSPMMSMSVDSADPSSGDFPGSEMITGLADMSYVVVMDRRGNIVGLRDIRGLEGLLAGAGNPMIAGVLQSTLSEEGLRNAFQQGVVGFPAEPVVVGSTWDAVVEMALPSVGTMISEMTYEVVATEPREDDTVVVIAVTGTISNDGDLSGLGLAGASAQLHGISTSGRAEFSVGLGRLLRSETITETSMSMSMGGQQIDITSVATMTMELADGDGR